MLKFEGITKSFKTEILAQPFTALSDVSFEIPAGSMVGFLGANGAGKTTSLKIIMDFIRSDKGEVIFSKELGDDRNKIFKQIGFLPERPYFYPNLSGEEFLTFMGRLSELSTGSIESAITKWSPRFKIDHALARPLRTYSKGMLQRIGFLATILHEPKFIILDEPLSGLDPIGRKELKDVIVDVHRSGKTVFFSSHIVPDIEEICDRVIFLKEGKLVYDGPVKALLESGAKTEYLVKFHAEHDPVFEVPCLELQKLPGSLYVLKVREQDKASLLSELIVNNLDIIAVELVKPGLEEIFYNIKMKS
jgi:ABC-2 type transport system ATP-binding protein